MNRKKCTLFFLMLAMLLSGCATINFSANYYTPPDNYLVEVKMLWNKIIKDFPSGHAYAITVARGSNSKRLKGIPAMSGNTVILPDEYVKYVYQNYYNDRYAIFTCTIVHELCHAKYDLPSKPPQKHLETDFTAIQVLGGNNKDTATNYYKSLQVMKNYWFARKGLGGHAFNVGWNVANAAVLALTGHGYFVDWFATDLSKRLQSLARHYKIASRMSFRRSRK